MTNFLLCVSFIICLALLICGIDRGFEISDEGFYMFLSVPAQANENGIINYDLFFKLFYQLTGHTFSLIEMRLLRLFGYFLGAFALTQFLKNQFEISLSKPQLFLLSTLGLFSGYAFLPPTLSYNSLTVVLSCFWLWSVFSVQASTYSRGLSLGLILALLVYVKVTVALILFLFSIGIWVNKKQFSLTSLGLVFVPFLILELIFSTVLGEFASDRLLSGIPLNSSRSGYGIIPMIKSPLLGLVFSVCTLLIGWMLAKIKSKSFPIQVGVLIFSAGIFFWMIRFTHITEEWNHVVMLGTSVFLGFLWGTSKSRINFSLEEMTLFLLPYLLHLGSNFYWLRIGIHYWVFWMFLVIIFAGRYSNLVHNTVPFLLSFLVFNGVWWHPYGQDKPLWSFKEDLNRLDEIIKVDKELAYSVIQIRDFAMNKGIGEISIAYGVPGLIWLSGYEIPHSAGVWNKIQLESTSDTPPKALVFCQHDSLPKGWIFTYSKTLGSVQGHPPIYLLWN